MCLAAGSLSGCGGGSPASGVSESSDGGAGGVFDFGGGNSAIGTRADGSEQSGGGTRPSGSGGGGGGTQVSPTGVGKVTVDEIPVDVDPSVDEEAPLYFAKRSNISGKITLFLNYTPTNADMKTLETDFKKIYPNTSLEFITSAHAAAHIKLAQTIQSGVYPDYIQSGWASAIIYAPKGYLQPINSYLTNSSQIMNMSIVRSLADKDGNIYMALQTRNPGLLYFNTDMFRNAGLDTPYDLWKKDAWTWAKMKEVATELTDASKGIYGFGTDWEQYFMLSAGTDLVAFKKDKTPYLNVDDPLLRESLLFFYDGVNKDKVFSPTRWGNLQDFINGKVAMICTRFGDYATMEANGFTSYGIAPFPKYNAKSPYIGLAEADGWCVGKRAKNPEGGMAYGEFILNRAIRSYGDKPRDPGKFSAEQLKMINSITNRLCYITAYGMYDTFFQAFGNFMRRNGDFAALLEEMRPVWERNIADTVKGN
jgi:ABC-type glycerol-3-phosphate transport system substrate-binding protein